MRRLISSALTVSILTLAAVINAGAQTTVPKEKIPADAPAAIKALIEDLYVSNPAYVAQTASKLGGLGKDGTAAIPFLIGVLYDDRPLKIVTSYGPVPICSPNPQVPCPISGRPTTAGLEAAKALSQMGELAFQPLLEAFRTGLPNRYDLKDSYVQQGAAFALGIMGDKRAAGALLQALNDPSYSRARESIALALGNIGEPGAVEPLIAALKDERLAVRISALTSLGRLRDRRAAEPILQIIGSQDREAKLTAAQALVNMGKPRPLEPLFTLLKAEDHSTEEAAAYALGQIGVEDKEESVVEPLIPKLSSEYMVRVSAARYLRQMGYKYDLAAPVDPALVDLLIADLNSKDQRVTVAAATLLGSMKIRRAVPALVEKVWSDRRGFMAGKEDDVSKSAGVALWQIRDPLAVDSLIAVAQKKNCGSEEGCYEISQALFQITGADLHTATEWQRWWLRNRRTFGSPSR